MMMCRGRSWSSRGSFQLSGLLMIIQLVWLLLYASSSVDVLLFDDTPSAAEAKLARQNSRDDGVGATAAEVEIVESEVIRVKKKKWSSRSIKDGGGGATWRRRRMLTEEEEEEEEVQGLLEIKAGLVDRSGALRTWKKNGDDEGGGGGGGGINDSTRTTWRRQRQAGRAWWRWAGIECDGAGHVAGVRLEGLSLSGRLDGGRVQRGLRKLRFLRTLSLAHNNLSGPILLPPGLLRRLRRLDLSRNALSGPLPASLGLLLPELAALDLSHNALHGDVPGSLSACAALRSLDLSSNRLNGTLLLPSLPPGLLLLNLSRNSLTSPPAALAYSQCGLLRALDLSANRLSGHLPRLLLCERIHYFNASHNSFRGPIISPPLLLSLDASPFITDLATLDLSHNQLSGAIPRSLIARAAASLSTLLLHRNRLTGSIPHEIGNCSSLASINLAHNKLSGSIPAEMGRLRELASLDLSFNELEGPVPEYGALLRFDAASFAGNARLCGANVNATCPSTAAKPLVLDPNYSTLIGGGGGAGSLRRGPSSSAQSSSSSATAHKEKQQHGGIMLSISAILAIAAAAAISAGVVVILLLNSYYSSARSRRQDAAALSDGAKSMMRQRRPMSSSARSLRGAGKLVMFSRRAQTSTDGDSVDSGGGGADEEEHDDLRSSTEEWVSSAHALLSKDSELAAAGGSGSGSIYKAVLGDGRTVVIKKLAISSAAKPQHEFEREVEPLGRIKHRNVVALRGYYWTPELQLLIYDFVPNGSLYKRLHEAGADCNEALLPWRARVKIAAGVAKGLAHLHHRCEPSVVHANVKSANVLLDERCDPKLADTGLLAHLLDQRHQHNNNNDKNKQHREHCIAPELFASDNTRRNYDEPCPSIDVYGFGMIVLELVTGRRPVEYAGGDPVPLRDYVRSSLDASMAMLCVDPKLPPDQYTEAEILPMIKLGLVCCSRDPQSRPTMAEVVQILDLIRA